MSNFVWKSWLISPAILVASGLMSWSAIAAEVTDNGKGRGESAIVISQVPDVTETNTIDDLNQTATDSLDPSELEQVTSVSQLRDVQPTDWAFQALQSLVERYGSRPTSTATG